ncbi:MAG: hypothetical protein ABI843_08175 [Dokdonella sp.]
MIHVLDEGDAQMRDIDVPVKTAAGRRELSERRHALHARQRTLLIAIHGEYTLHELRRQFQALGDVDAIIDELHGAGLVEPQRIAAAIAPAAPVAAAAVEAIITPLQLARQFMNETAVAALGLRAFLFTLKIEKCYSKPDLEALMPEYRRVMGKARNAPYAEAMVLRAEAMLAKA